MNLLSQPLINAAFEQGVLNKGVASELKMMRDVLLQEGVRVSLHQMQEIWEHYSAKRDAQWMSVSSVGDIHVAATEFIKDRLQIEEFED